MANVVIIGGGFAGLIAAEELARKAGNEHRITLVSTRKDFVFYPALVKLAFGHCEPDDITFDLEEKLNEIDVRFVEGEVLDVQTSLNQIKVIGNDFHGSINYDYLLVATGRRLATERMPGYFEHANHVLSVDGALEFGEAMRTFKSGQILVVMPNKAQLPVPVCETAFALAKKFTDEPRKGEVSITAVFPEVISDAFGGAKIHKELEESFRDAGISLLTSFDVELIMPNEVVSSGGKSLPFDLLMMVPPFKGHQFTKYIGDTDEQGFLITNQHMKVKGCENVYAAGDVVSLAGPKFAHAAVNQARVAAKNIGSELAGVEPDEPYYHEIATIIDAQGPETIYLHFGVWDRSLRNLKKGGFWSFVKKMHDRLWQAKHSN